MFQNASMSFLTEPCLYFDFEKTFIDRYVLNTACSVTVFDVGFQNIGEMFLHEARRRLSIYLFKGVNITQRKGVWILFEKDYNENYAFKNDVSN